MFFMERIWVEGFTHLVALLGLVSAALVVTNKETIMNFVGCLVITWRDLFIENDLIQIQNYKGYVKSIGVLYFSLAEVSDGVHGDITGRIIRVPNGLVSNNALINFSQTSHLLEQKFSVIITQDSDVESSIQFVEHLVNEVIARVYSGKKEYSREYLGRRNKNLLAKMNLHAKVSITLKVDKPSGVELTARYHCFSQDAESIQQAIWINFLKLVKKQDAFALSYVA
jgi:small-conductance mechanosensitive channel